MDDITKSYRFQRILHEAAQYRMLRQIFDADRDYETTLQPTDYYRRDLACDDEKKPRLIAQSFGRERHFKKLDNPKN